MKYLLAHDLGTTGDKATLYSEDGTLIKSIIAEYPTHYGKHGVVEQNPEDWWKAVCETTSAMADLVDKKEIAAICFGGHMMGCLPMDKNCRPLRNSIIWADTRSQKQADELGERYGVAEFYQTTGHRLSPSHTIPKFMWVKEHEPDVYKETYKTICCKDYIAYKMTGQLVTDYSDASGTLAYNIRKKCWAEDLIESAGLDIEKFPEIRDGSQVLDVVTEAASKECGLLAGTPVVLGGGDGEVAAIGAGVTKLGAGYTCLGTSAWDMACVPEPVQDPTRRIVTWNHVIPDLLTPTGTMQAFGASIAWMRENLCQEEVALAKETGISKYDYINANAAKSPVGANGLLFLPYLHGERSPHWNAEAKGVFVGLTMKHTVNDMKRAVMEGCVFNMGLIHNIFLENGLKVGAPLMVVGGAANSPLVMQALADMYDMELCRTNQVDEAGSMGGAILAGRATGVFDSLDVLDRFAKITQVVKPIPENVAKYKEILPVFQEAYDALVPVFPKLNQF